MDTITESLASVSDAVTKAVGAMQSQVLALHRDAAAAVAKVGDLPWVPSTEPLPSVDSVVEQAYRFQVERLEADKQFALELLDVWTPKPTSSRSKTSK
jgi:hypothetical protein